MVEEINPITTKNKNKNELRILAAMHTLFMYPENDHDPDCDKYLRRNPIEDGAISGFSGQKSVPE